MLKQAFDRGVAAVAIVVALPVFALLAIGVLLDDGLPVFFGQERIGRGGHPFVLWKFRTMRRGSDSVGQLATEGDPRVTRFGAVQRRFKLDELPQLLNVLRGEMSFVGPRPELARYVALYTPEQREVLSFNPGITDPASIAYINEGMFLARFEDQDRAYIERVLPDKLRLSLAYAERAGFWADLGVIGVTILASVRHRATGNPVAQDRT